MVAKFRAVSIALRSPATITIGRVPSHLARAGFTPPDICNIMAAHRHRSFRTLLYGLATDQRLELDAVQPDDRDSGDVVRVPELRVQVEFGCVTLAWSSPGKMLSA